MSEVIKTEEIISEETKTAEEIRPKEIIPEEIKPEKVVSMEELEDEIEASFDNFRDVDAQGWDKCAEYMEEQTILELPVEGIANDKGVIVMTEGIRGFVPASHISLKRVDDLNEYLGKTLQLHIIEADPLNKRLILSARKILQDKVRAERLAKIQAIKPGTIVEGTVDSLKPYGAFIKIDDDVTGLVHVSQISLKRIQDPSNVLKKGEKVKAKVLNTKDGKLSLSMKAILEDERAKKEAEERNVKLPQSEKIGSSMADLLKNIKID